MTPGGGTGPRQQKSSAARPRAHPDSGLTDDQTDTLYRALVDKRQRVLEGRQQHLDIGRFATERIVESEEAAAWDTSQSTMIDLAETERRLLVQIERALRRMQDGTYGVSEESEEPIGFDRLCAIPWASLSAADQEQREHEARERGR